MLPPKRPYDYTPEENEAMAKEKSEKLLCKFKKSSPSSSLL
jgi:hypothetical protein